MKYPRLNLSGIHRNVPTPHHTKPRVSAQPTVTVKNCKVTMNSVNSAIKHKPKTHILESKKHLVIKKKYNKLCNKFTLFLQKYPRWGIMFFCCILLFVVVSLRVIVGGQHRMLRSIQKVPCIQVKGEHVCSSKYRTGTMIISTSDKCRKYIYDINGIPFINIEKFFEKIMVVPAHQTLRIRGTTSSCDVHVQRTSKTNTFAPPASGVVWITSRRHTFFTMTVDTQIVLDETPVGMLKSSTNGEWVAYQYDPEMPRMQDIQIVGDSEDKIYIYP